MIPHGWLVFALGNQMGLLGAGLRLFTACTCNLILSLKKWLVMTQNHGVMDPFLQGHGE